MANRFQKLIYYLSAEAPILIVFAVIWLIEKSTWTRPVSISWKVPIVLIGFSALFIVFFNCSFRSAMNNLQIIQVTGTKYTNGDSWIIAYVISYLLSLTSFKFGEYVKPVVGIVIAILLLLLTFTNYITPHPLLYLKGYRFYVLDVEDAASGYYLISKRKISNASEVKKVSRIFDFLLVKMG